MSLYFVYLALLVTAVSAQSPTATALLIVNQGPNHRCYSWYAEGGPGSYPDISEWNYQYDDRYGRFTLGTVNWPFSNFRTSPGYKYAPGDFTSSATSPGCAPCNCPVQPTDPAKVCNATCSTTAVQPPPTPAPSCPSPQTLYGQCGGSNWNGPTCCSSGAYCPSPNVYYSQCVASSAIGGGGNAGITTSTSALPPPSQATQTAFGQCGGSGWNGPTACPGGTTCQHKNGNAYYYQCLP